MCLLTSIIHLLKVTCVKRAEMLATSHDGQMGYFDKDKMANSLGVLCRFMEHIFIFLPHSFYPYAIEML